MERKDFSFPATGEGGSGQSPEKGSRGFSPCGFLGQSPKPPEDMADETYAILSVIIPQIKQASSRAIAVTAVFRCLSLCIIL